MVRGDFAKFIVKILIFKYIKLNDQLGRIQNLFFIVKQTKNLNLDYNKEQTFYYMKLGVISQRQNKTEYCAS